MFHPETLGLKGVGPWNAHPMLQRVFPKGNVYNESVDFTCNARWDAVRVLPCMPRVDVG